MAFAITDGIPGSIVKGDAYSFTVADACHAANASPAWTSILYLKNPAGTVISVVGSASGADHLFALTNAITATLTVGRNLVCVAFSDGTHRETSEWTGVDVLPDPSATEPVSAAAAMVAAIDAAMLINAGKAAGSYSGDGISFTWRSADELIRLRAYWQSRVIQEQNTANAARGFRSGRILTEFVQ